MLISNFILKQTCNKCGKYLSLEQFFYDKTKGNYWKRCNPCIATMRRFRKGQSVRASAKDSLETVVQRILSNCKKQGKCLEWQGANAGTRKYGNIRYKGKLYKTHRLIYCYHNNIDPEDLTADDIVCHSCDNPACCKYKHLVLGDHLDNMEDKVSKNRHLKKLKAEDVKKIKKLLRKGKISVQDIAIQFNVSDRLVYLIGEGKRHAKTNLIKSKITCEAA